MITMLVGLNFSIGNKGILLKSGSLSAGISSQTNVTVYGQSTGSVTVAGSGGTGPYTYAKGSGSYGSSGTFSGLAAGSYTIHVKDATGDIVDVDVEITQPVEPLKFSADSDSISIDDDLISIDQN